MRNLERSLEQRIGDRVDECDSQRLFGVDGGADALIEAGYRPDVIVGDMDSVTDPALSCGAELLIHGYEGGDAPGAERVEKLGLKY